MEYNTKEKAKEISQEGVEYEIGSLYEYFEKIEDPRHARGKRYRLTTLLVIIFLAKMGGEDTPLGIADWAKVRRKRLKKMMKLRYEKMPHHSTYRKVFSEILGEDEFEKVMKEYTKQIREGKGEGIAIDGKTLRGTIAAGETRGLHILNVYDTEEGLTLTQIEVDRKENEIVAAPKALAEVDLRGKVVTGDAMHTQRKVSAEIVECGGDYLWVVKENQGRLYEAIEQLFAPEKEYPGIGKLQTDFKRVKKTNKGHGRLEARDITTSAMLNDYVNFPYVGQVYRLMRHFRYLRKGNVIKVHQETEYGITSLSSQVAEPERVLRLRRNHWKIETGLHYRRDVTFHEDAVRMKNTKAAKMVAVVNNLVLSIFSKTGFHNSAQARRYFAANPTKAFSLLISTQLRL
jgi:predicted transposase YbfD/YdcC